MTAGASGFISSSSFSMWNVHVLFVPLQVFPRYSTTLIWRGTENGGPCSSSLQLRARQPDLILLHFSGFAPLLSAPSIHLWAASRKQTIFPRCLSAIEVYEVIYVSQDLRYHRYHIPNSLPHLLMYCQYQWYHLISATLILFFCEFGKQPKCEL